ncbi:hypothetical protein GCM10009007_05620 [Formosimonas limnophila]|uniref:MmcQ-like protein n=1 Tax=Formosimonas limnophila TaxID=1384487 RepID=A0A8J3CGF0_9BURK|nr:MmcQ/YjbR family DNA-binding protein [Formosimonas limnophila]GHA67962.1 hypothetical protein GCM10009007_05620 [Formosimonas limnophila]
MTKNNTMGIEDWRAFFLSMPAAIEDMPFGPEVLVYKVAGKMFGLLAWQGEPLSMNLKCEPNLAIDLRAQYTTVTPGYHMNKKHWNTITLDDTVSDDMVKDWLRASYNLVCLSLPKKVQNELQCRT